MRANTQTLALLVFTCMSNLACKEQSFAGRSERRDSGSDGTKKPPGKPGGPPSDADPNKKPPGGTPEDLGTDSGNKELSTLKKPKFALMARDLRCGMCHVTINGDLVSTSNVMTFEPDSRIPAPGSDDHIVTPYRIFSMAGEYNEIINGSWFINGSFPSDRSKTKMKLVTTSGIKENYTGPEVPKNGFPKLDLAKAAKVSVGTLEGKDNKGADVKITGTSPGNVVLDGTKATIKISGEVLVNGDLIILGKYEGRGTIYTKGNIYIAGSIEATKPAFPFSPSRAEALAEGKSRAAAAQMDGLALVANSSIILGDPNHQTVSGTPKLSPSPVADKNVLTWYPTYSSIYSGKIGKGIDLKLDVFLYAQHTIAGKTGLYTINGGMICDSFHILGLGKSSGGRNVINYDFRMANGLKVMEAFDDSF